MKAIATAQWILEKHTPYPLSDDIPDKIRVIIDETEKDMGLGMEIANGQKNSNPHGRRRKSLDDAFGNQG